MRKEAVRVFSLRGEARELGHPVRRHQGERMPALAPPRLCNAASFEHHMCSPLLREVVAQSKPCLPATDNHDVYLLHHLLLLFLAALLTGGRSASFVAGLD